MVEWNRDSFILARGFALRKRKCDFICAISGQLKRKRHFVSNFTADHSARFFSRRLARIPSWPLAKREAEFLFRGRVPSGPRSRDRDGILLYSATHDLTVKIHVSYEAVQHAKKHGLTDNRVSENRSGTNDLLSTRKRATKFSKRETISIRFSKISLMAFFFYDNTFANWNFAPFVLSISKSPKWIAFWFILNLSNDIII